MKILEAVKAPNKNFGWVHEAFQETWKKPWGQRLKHLRYRLLWELRPLLRWPGSYPLAVDIEASSYCNFRCVFCQQAQGWWNKLKITLPDSHMPWEIFTKIVDQCA